MTSRLLALRALAAVAALPGIVAFAVPIVLARSAGGPPFSWLGLVALVPGIALLAWCVREFAVAGRGTLAPWDPPRRLVTTGAYAISRNPIYLAVALILLGWAIGFRSWRVLVYALAVMAAFHIHVVFVEEPRLARTHREHWHRYAARTPRWCFRTKRAVAWTWAAVLVAIPIAGLVYEAWADGTAMLELMPPGTLVDVGGRRLHLLCIGEGEPTVIVEGAGFQHALSSARLRERLASRATVCSYDRAGTGWSDPASGPISAGDQARELAVLQDRAGLRGPFIIIASSVGGLTAEMFARQFPERVAGLVFLDAANSYMLEQRDRFARWLTPAACGAGFLAHFGVIRLLDPLEVREEGSDEARRAAALNYNARRWMQICSMARGLDETVSEFASAPPLPAGLPVLVLSAASSDELAPGMVRRVVDVEEFQSAAIAAHKALASATSKGSWQLVPDSTHLIASSQPDAVADAVLQMIEELPN